MSTVRWNISVSSETDRDLRMFLAERNRGRKGDLSRFIEEAVRERIFTQTVEEIKARNADISEEELAALIDEALDSPYVKTLAAIDEVRRAKRNPHKKVYASFSELLKEVEADV